MQLTTTSDTVRTSNRIPAPTRIAIIHLLLYSSLKSEGSGPGPKREREREREREKIYTLTFFVVAGVALEILMQLFVMPVEPFEFEKNRDHAAHFSNDLQTIVGYMALKRSNNTHTQMHRNAKVRIIYQRLCMIW